MFAHKGYEKGKLQHFVLPVFCESSTELIGLNNSCKKKKCSVQTKMRNETWYLPLT